MRKSIYKSISESCCVITVFLGNEKISQGTGFCCLPTGEVITAAHVITGRMPISSEDVNDPDVRVFAKFPYLPLFEYKVMLCSLRIIVDSFLEEIQIDIAVLQSIRTYKEYPTALTTCLDPPELGDEVYIAGFSDELLLPYQIDKLVKETSTGVSEFLDAMKKGYQADMTGPMIKRATVGNIRRIIASNDSQNISSDIFYLDKGMHSGASGGPVVDLNGNVVGLITQRAITPAFQTDKSKLMVPSGSTVCISFSSLLALNN